MNWRLILAGIVDDPYVDRQWILLVLSCGGAMLCLYRYKLGFLVIPIVAFVAAIFLTHFYEPDVYRRITKIANRTPPPIMATFLSIGLPIAVTFVSWRKSRNNILKRGAHGRT